MVPVSDTVLVYSVLYKTSFSKLLNFLTLGFIYFMPL